MNFLIILLALIFTNLVHKLGHLLAAQWRGLTVVQFAIGVGPRLFGWSRRNVEYRFSMIPFGGYLQLNSEEASDCQDEKDKKESKTTDTDRMIVASMGAVANLAFAFSLVAILWFTKGNHVTYAHELTTEVGHVQEKLSFYVQSTDKNVTIPGPAYLAGVKPGDKILTVDGAEVRNFQDIRNRIAAGIRRKNGSPVVHLEVEREGKKQAIEIQPGIVAKEEMRMIGIGPKQTFFVDTVIPGMPAEKAGLEANDQLLAIDGQPIHSFHYLTSYLSKLDTNASVELTVLKGGEEGPKKTYSIMPVSKTLQQGNELVSKRLIGFKPKFKTVSSREPKLISWVELRLKDTFQTLQGLVRPASEERLRMMRDYPGLMDSLAFMPFKFILWSVVLLNLCYLATLPIDILSAKYGRSSRLR